MSKYTEMVKKNLNDFEQTATTPYIKLDNMEYRKFTTRAKPVEVMDTDTGEIASLVYSGKVAFGFKDTNSYSKLFTSGKLQLSLLSTSGLKVFCYILLNISPNKESICLDLKSVAQDMGYKNTKNVYDGIIDLLENNVISRKTSQSCFWINPNMFFNGDRTKLLDNETRKEYNNELKGIAKEMNEEFKP